MYFPTNRTKGDEKMKKIIKRALASILVLCLAVVPFCSVSASAATPQDEIMPLYSAAAYIEFGSFFQRLDSLFLLIWTLSFACYLSIVTKFGTHILKKITNIKDIKAIVYPYSFTLLAIALVPKNYAVSKFYETNIYPYLVIGLVFFVGFSILLFAYLKNRKKVGVINE